MFNNGLTVTCKNGHAIFPVYEQKPDGGLAFPPTIKEWQHQHGVVCEKLKAQKQEKPLPSLDKLFQGVSPFAPPYPRV